MKRRFTKAQEQAISLRDKNILVSAAAGSGKTAVLVERIIRMISEGENKKDIDRLLVVTFTNAAAGEMRERISAAIAEKLISEPENEHLQRQATLIHNAQITTIHSFCLFVIRNHFQEIGLDPAFRVADEGEVGLLMQDVLAEVLEEAFGELERAEGKTALPKGVGRSAAGQGEMPAFQALVEAYGAGKKETVLEESILALHRFAMSYPWPEEWLRKHGEDYEIHSVEELENSCFVTYVMKYLQSVLPEMAEELRQCVRICEKPDGPYMYGENLEKTLRALEEAGKAISFHGMREVFSQVAFDRLSSKKDDSVDSEKRELIKQIRNDVKKQVEQLDEQFFNLPEDLQQGSALPEGTLPAETILAQCIQISPVVRELAALTIRFGERFAAKKREKNLIDFSDMEHLALEILCRRPASGEGAFAEPTAAALALRDYFEEIMIDEYQDSNLVQECILGCISGERAGRYDRFMVGDVKQSIYKFRLARPEIFMEKFHTYSVDEGAFRRVDLDQNFRSRREVIESVNLIFEQLLGKDLGGIDYDERARLHYGASYYDAVYEEEAARNRDAAGQAGIVAGGDSKITVEMEKAKDRITSEMEATEDNITGETEENEEKDRITHETDTVEDNITYEIDMTEDDITHETKEAEPAQNRTEFLLIEKSEDDEKDATQQEAEVIALRIKRLMREMKVLDADGGGMRPLCYRDIVILLRTSGSGIDETFEEVLGRHGIPCYINSQTGYFKTSEVQVILQLLRTIENPLQDIPLFGVLKSCFGAFTDVEAARIAAAFPGRQKLYKKLKRYAEGTDDLAEKCRKFLGWHENLRRASVWLSVREMLTKIMEESHYTEYVAAMPGGEKRRANAGMLLQKAASFEKTSFKGVYHFIRYIDQIEKYDIDYGEAGTGAELSDVVRIMTIHKSKGLEFPVCFVAGMGRKMNRRDAAMPVLTDIDMGIAVDQIDPVLRTRRRTLKKTALSKKILLDSQAEELRVLYVALTRAKEKLIITGVTDDAKRLLRAKSFVLRQRDTKLSYLIRSSAGSFLELIVACLMRTSGMETLLVQSGISIERAAAPLAGEIACEIVRSEDLQMEMFAESVKTVNDMESFKANLRTYVIDDKVKEYLQNRFGYRYPHGALQKLYAKTTVSELKMAAIHNMAGHAQEEIGEEQDGGKKLFEEETPAPYLPLFLRKQGEEETVSGKIRGSAVHRVLELIEFGDSIDSLRSSDSMGWRYDERRFKADLERFIGAGLLSEEYRKAVKTDRIRDKILRFLESPLAGRMHLAAKAGKLRKEQPFMLGIPADRLSEEFPATEQIIVQGIIDVFFEEDGEIVLLDYKTDVIKSPQELADRYRVQLDYYAEALERMTGKRVKERILYSFCLETEVKMELF